MCLTVQAAARSGRRWLPCWILSIETGGLSSRRRMLFCVSNGKVSCAEWSTVASLLDIIEWKPEASAVDGGCSFVCLTVQAAARSGRRWLPCWILSIETGGLSSRRRMLFCVSNGKVSCAEWSTVASLLDIIEWKPEASAVDGGCSFVCLYERR